MDQWRGKAAFVSGASAGIGYDVSKKLCELGMNVLGCARNVEKIEELAKMLNGENVGRLVAVKCDVSIEEEVKAAFEKARTEFGGVDVCINNAGLAHSAPLLTGATSDWKNMLDVNVLGLCICTREFVQQLQKRSVNFGHIVLLNSLSGHRLVTSSTTNTFFYGATKYAVTALTEGIRRELRQMKSDVKVTSISPGLVRTEFSGRMRKVEDIEQSKKDYDDWVLEAEDVTSAVVYTLSTPPRMQIHDILIRPTQQVF